jgi:hypothetical protein
MAFVEELVEGALAIQATLYSHGWWSRRQLYISRSSCLVSTGIYSSFVVKVECRFWVRKTHEVTC